MSEENGAGAAATAEKVDIGNQSETAGGAQPTDGKESHWTESLGLPEDLKAEKEILKYKTPADLVKGHISQSKLIGRSIRLPDDKTPPEEKAAFMSDIYNKLGRPESADKYVIEKPELPQGITYHEPVVKAFAAEAHKHGLSQDQLKFALDFHNKFVADGFYENQRQEKETIAKTEAELKKLWGDQGYKRNLEAAHTALKTFASKEDMDYIANSGLGNDPRMIRIFANISKRLSEASDHRGDTTEEIFLDAEMAKKEIAAVRNDPKHRYNKAYMDAKDPLHKEAMKYIDELYARMEL